MTCYQNLVFRELPKKIMATLTLNAVKLSFSVRVFCLVGAVCALVLLLTLLAMAIMDDPTPSQDIRILDWIVGSDFWE